MEAVVGNSFYYFFSATPQVLAAILALFGLFVVFKIQDIKNQLLGIGQSIIDEVQSPVNWKKRYSLNASKDNFQSVPEFKNKINERNIKELQNLIHQIEHPSYTIFKDKYNELYSSRENLINNTTRWSIVTAIIIVFCLVILFLDNCILNHTTILYILFAILIIYISF